MRKSRFSEEQIIGVLREHEGGTVSPLWKPGGGCRYGMKVCRGSRPVRRGISDATIFPPAVLPVSAVLLKSEPVQAN